MDLFESVPSLSSDDARTLLAATWGIEGATVTELPSERDQNFRVSVDGAPTHVLKVANATEDPAFLDAQQAVWLHTAAHPGTPNLVSCRDGAATATVPGVDGHEHVALLLTWVDGRPLADRAHRPSSLLRSLGEALGEMDAVLDGFDHPGAHRTFHWDLQQARAQVDEHRHTIADPAVAEQVDAVVAMWDERVAPAMADLRRSVIHSDANDHNVMTAGDDVTGIIDFGDMVHSVTVANVAIAGAYACLDTVDPLAAIQAVVGGYHERHPLTDGELEVVWPMTLMRLAVSSTLAAVQMAARPDDEYLAVSQAPIQRTLPKLLAHASGYGTAAMRSACGLEPIPTAPDVREFLAGITDAPPILDAPLTPENSVHVDMRVASAQLPWDRAWNPSPGAFAPEGCEEFMEAAGASYGIGGYDEARLIYTHPMFRASDEYSSEWRTIHTGLDLFAPAGTPVHCPLPGVVHSVRLSPGEQDYGHVILVRHATDTGTEFHTLYGHLSAASVDMVQPGQAIDAGTQIATLGAPHENGGWSPHLHLMVITDLLDNTDEFAGVGFESQRDVWTSLCLDPSGIAGVPDGVVEADRTHDATLADRRRLLGPSLSLSYDRPLRIERGWMQHLWDERGRRYLDAYNNVPHVGHSHPRVTEAAVDQLRVLNTNTRYLHEQRVEYARRLTDALPDGLDVCFFVSSASEANELALRLQRAATGSRDLIVNEGAYHGHTTTLIDISPYKHDGPGGEGRPGWVHAVPLADTYRGPHRGEDAGARHAADVAATIDALERSGRRLGGFIAETAPSVGGQIILPPGYLAGVYEHVRAAGGICIADEVQTGFGRTGSFCAFDAQDVVPDIVIFGKPIGNGHPLAAVVTSREIAEAFDTGMEWFATFGGNTVACAVGLAVLDVVEEDGLTEHAGRVGAQMLDDLRELQSRHEIVGDVRGAGLFLGVELVRDRDTLEAADAEAAYVASRMAELGILLGTDGPLHNVVKIRPPMPFTGKDGADVVEQLDRVLSELTPGPRQFR